MQVQCNKDKKMLIMHEFRLIISGECLSGIILSPSADVPIANFVFDTFVEAKEKMSVTALALLLASHLKKLHCELSEYKVKQEIKTTGYHEVFHWARLKEEVE